MTRSYRIDAIEQRAKVKGAVPGPLSTRLGLQGMRAARSPARGRRHIQKAQTRPQESFLGASGFCRYARIACIPKAGSEMIEAIG